MDWTGMLRESWRIMRGTPALWGLGAISALQGALYAVIVAGLIVPMTALTQILVIAGSAPAAVGRGASPLQAFAPGVIAWIQQWEPQLIGGIISIIVLWAGFGVLDVAATGGIVTQTSKAAEGREASAGAGMRDGFGVWWRTVGLLAVAAMPYLLYLLVVALFTLFTISIPLSVGLTPSLSAIGGGNAINGVLSLLVSLVGIPLGILVLLGLRYAVIEGQHWRVAFLSAWRLAGQHLAEVALMYLLQTGISIAAVTAVSVVLGTLVLVAGISVSLLVAAAHTFSGAAMFVTIIAALLVAVVASAYGIAVVVWFSVAWTVFWRRIIGRESVGAVPAYRSAAPQGVGQGEAR